MTATSPGRKAAAFFDLDRTVIARSSTLALAGPLRKAGLVKRRTLLRAVMGQAVYRVAGADRQRIDRVRDHLTDLSKGWKAARIRQLVQEAIDEVISPLIYAEAIVLMDDHRREGREVVIVSAAPEDVVRPLARHLGVDHVIATRSTLDQAGRYTGELAFYATGPDKARAAGELAERWGLDLEQCFAYSDSVDDLPMLETVGHPVAVNPDRALKQQAEERGWPVVEFARPVTLRTRLADLPGPLPVVSGAVLVTAVAGAVAFRLLRTRRTVA